MSDTEILNQLDELNDSDSAEQIRSQQDQIKTSPDVEQPVKSPVKIQGKAFDQPVGISPKKDASTDHFFLEQQQDQETKIVPSYGNDDMPIGGKSSFMVDEFPPEGQQVKKRIPPAKKGNKVQKENDEKIIAIEEQPLVQVKKVSEKSNALDEQPVGGGKKFMVSEFPDGVNGNDEKPIGGKSDFKIDEYPPTDAVEQKKKVPPKKASKVVKRVPVEDNIVTPMEVLDEIPVGGGSKFMVSEYAEDEAPPEENKEAPSLQQRLRSKVWKNRQSAFEEMCIIFENAQAGDAALGEFSEEWPKFLADANPGSQEKALQAFRIYLQKCDPREFQQKVDGKELLTSIVEKCISPGKPQIKKLAMELLPEIFEKRDKTEQLESLKLLLQNKNQKIISAAITAIIELLLNFGPKRLDFLKPFFNDIEKQAQQTSQVRLDCMTFYREAYKWLGEQLMQNYTRNLKKAQLEELEKFYAEWGQQKMTPLKGGASVDLAAQSASAAIDVYDIVDSLNLFIKYNEKWFDTVLALTKWSEKVDQIEEMIKAGSVPKLTAPTSIGSLLSFLKKLLNDAHVNVNTAVIKLIKVLVRGIRKNFHGLAKVLFPLLMMKLREKKTILIDETRATLENMSYAIGIEDVLDDLKEGLADKTPQLKVQILLFISSNQMSRALAFGSQASWKVKNQDGLKQLLSSIKKLLEDSVPEVREAALNCLGKIKIHLPDSALSQLQDIGQAKIQKMNEISNAQGGDKDNNTASQSVIQTQAKGDLRSSIVVTSSNPKKNTTAPVVVVEKIITKVAPIVPEDTEPTLEEVEGHLRNYGLEDEFFSAMEGNVAKDKVQAIKSLQDQSDLFSSTLDSLLWYLKKKTKDFKDSNLTLNKELFALCHFIRQIDPQPLCRKSFAPLCRFLVERMSDVKFKDDISTLLESSCVTVPPSYVALQLLKQAAPRGDKNSEKTTPAPPKTVAEIAANLVRITNLVSVKYLSLKELLDFAREGTMQTNPIIKQASVELLKTLYMHVGPDLVNFLNDVPPQTLKVLQSEFEKVQVIPANQRGQNQIVFKGEAAIELKQTTSSSSNSNPLDQLPRTDISGELPKIMKKLQESLWQKKKDGLEELERILTSNNNNIQMTGIKDLVEVLKLSISDKSKTIIKPLLSAIGHLAEACGKDFKILGRQFIGPVLGLLSDKQVPVRQDAVVALERLSQSIGHEQVVQAMPQLLILDSPELKQELLAYILKYPEGLQKQEVKFFVAPLLNCLCDRVKEVRALSDQVIERAVQIAGIEPFMSAIKDLKPAVVQQIKPTLARLGAEFDDGVEGNRKRNNRTPKGKGDKSDLSQTIQSTTPPPLAPGQRKMNRNGTKNDLNNSLENFDVRNSRLDGTPTRPNQRLLPTDMNMVTPKDSQQFDSRGQYSSVQGVFLEGSLIAQSVSIRELKVIRMASQELTSWVQEQLTENNINELNVDMKICFKEGIYKQLVSYDYRQIVQSLKLLSTFCSETMQKNNCIEVSDLLLKWAFIKLFGGCTNEPLLKSLNSFLGQFLTALDKTGYSFNDIEILILTKVIREIIYNSTFPDERLISGYIKMSGPEKVVRLWIGLLKTDPATIHPHLQIEHTRVIIEDMQFKLFQLYLINYLNNDLLSELAKIPQLHRQNELTLELQRTYGDQVLRRAGILSDPSQIAGQKNTQIPKQQYNQQQQYQQGLSINTVQQQRGTVDKSQVSPRTMQFKQCLNSLLSPQVATKIESLMQINDLIAQCEQQNQQISGNNTNYPMYLFVNQADVLCTCFHSLMTWSFQAGESVPPQYRQFLLQALQKLYQLQPYVKALQYEPLCTFTEDLMLRLLAEDDHKAQVDQGDQIVKQLNSTTLRILENTEPDMVYAILLDLLIKYRRKQQQQSHQPQSKVVNLLMKCIMRVSKFLEKYITTLQVDMLLWKFHHYMAEFSQEHNFPADDIGMKTIKTILTELVKLLGDRIWDAYQIINNSDQADQHISQWIKMLLANTAQATNVVKNSSSTTAIVSPRDRIDQRRIGLGVQPPRANNNNDLSLSQVDLQMRRAVEMLKRQDMQDEGVKQIVEMAKKSPNLKWQNYLTDVQNKNIINFINQQLDKPPQRPQMENNTPPPQRFQSENQVQSNNVFDKSNSNIAELDQRITQLRMRVSMRPDENVDDKVNQQNFMTTPPQSNGSVGGQQVKTPDFLMQRLNDMKNRVQTLVGSQPCKNNFNTAQLQ